MRQELVHERNGRTTLWGLIALIIGGDRAGYQMWRSIRRDQRDFTLRYGGSGVFKERLLAIHVLML